MTYGRRSFASALQLGGEGRSPRELFAGVTLAALALPLNIGYATAAGLPATVGVYATIFPLAAFALITGSRQLIVGPDATIAALLAAALGPIVARGADPQELAWATALCVGLTLLVFWAFRLGGLVRFVSKPVLVGFIAGLGIEVLTSQLRKIMAVSVEADRWPAEVIAMAREAPDVSAASVALGLGTIVALRALRRFTPRVPGALLVLAAATALVAAFEPDGIEVLGAIPSGLPRPTFPTLGLDVWLDLLAVAVAIAVLTTAEGLLLAQRYARLRGEAIDANGEVFALGTANVVAAVSGGMPIGASASRTAALEAVGARTQVPSIVAAVVVTLVVLFFTDAVARLPEAALAGLVANAVVSTIEVSELRRLGRLRRSELAIALGCAAGVLLIGPIGGIVLAVLVSAIDVVRRVAATPWVTLVADVPAPRVQRFRADPHPGRATHGLRILRPGGPLFFANADLTRTAVAGAAEDPEVDCIVLDLERVADIDPTAAEALLEGIAIAATQNTAVAFSRVTGPTLELLDRYGIVAVVGADRIFDSNRSARAAHRSTSGDDP